MAHPPDPYSTTGTPTISGTQNWAPDACLKSAVVLPAELGSGLSAQAYAQTMCWASSISTLVVSGIADTSTFDVSIATSVDGITWVPRSTPFSGQGSILAMEWSPSLALFVALGWDPSTDGLHSVMTSPDGITWTLRATPASMFGASSICWSPGLAIFVVGKRPGVGIQVCLSSDGITWTLASPGMASNTEFGTQGLTSAIVWAPALSQFVALDQAGTAGVVGFWISSDGNTWVEHTPGALSTGPLAIAWSPSLGLFVFGPMSSTHVMNTSPDGITWTYRSSQWDSGLVVGTTPFSIAWSPSLTLFAALGLGVVAGGYQSILTSPDGITWSEQTTPADHMAAQTGQIVWADTLGLFVVACNNQYPASPPWTTIMTSPDGSTWTHQVGPFDGGVTIFTHPYCRGAGTFDVDPFDESANPWSLGTPTTAEYTG